MADKRSWTRLIWRAAVLLGLIAAATLPVPVTRAGGGFIVNSESDQVFADGELTLREALYATSLAPGNCGFSDAERALLVGCTWSPDTHCFTGGCGAGYYNNIIFAESVHRIRLYQHLAVSAEGTWIDGSKDGGGKVIISPWPAAYADGSVITIEGKNDTISNVSIVDGDPVWADVMVWVSASGARVAYNSLGVLPGASTCLPSTVSRLSGGGIQVRGSPVIPLTDQAFIYGNVIGCHTQDGILADDSEGVYIGYRPDKTTADGNWIGMNSSGALLPNGGYGVRLYQQVSHTMPVSNNTIVGNHRGGVAITGAGYGIPVRRNAIYGNGGIPIDLGADGPTPNDPIDLDSGPNNLINYPEVTTVSGSQVWGTACPFCIVDIYSSAGYAPRGNGGVYKTSTGADVSGHWYLDLSSVPVLAGLQPADLAFVTYDSVGGSSEMNPSLARGLYLPFVRKQ